ncbi:MAG: bifunctional 4-hydroxy-2-oxoglutarate aldolase/2-dehydro-3-deoxy-phosphogluconate aldolase [Candidatus Acidiferrales bacterium]|jgi:2-dehydro-3-deoxyphosphogluconate aldolase/(4S)-4-hydroxy-2-oxoglutarate aldolase
MTKQEVHARIEEIGIIAAVRERSKQNALFAAEAAFDGGIPIVEIALTVPGETIPGETELISHLAEKHTQLLVGAGSVLNVTAAQACLDSGAQFLTCDGPNHALVEFAAQKGVVVFPGALSPGEVIAAWESGCDFVKVVPCACIGGETYIESLHKMFPHIPLIAAGGVSQTSASKYILAGAVALGIGGGLFPSRAIRNQDANQIHELARRLVAFVKGGREGQDLPRMDGGSMKLPE